MNARNLYHVVYFAHNGDFFARRVAQGDLEQVIYHATQGDVRHQPEYQGLPIHVYDPHTYERLFEGQVVTPRPQRHTTGTA